MLFITFGSLLAMALPLVIAIAALVSGLMTVGLVSHIIGIASIGPELATLIGLGVGIDYALFIVTRHRNNIKAGMSPEEAAAQAVDSSGRAVLFAGTTVCIALLGLLILHVSYLSGLGIAAAITVLFTMAADGAVTDGAAGWWARWAGLSTDYEVFLVSRIHEEWVTGRDNHRAVTAGQATSGRVIIAAATIMIFVFAAFILDGQQAIGEFGLGLAAAVLLDAFILRTRPSCTCSAGRTGGCPAGWTASCRTCPSSPPGNHPPRPARPHMSRKPGSEEPVEQGQGTGQDAPAATPVVADHGSIAVARASSETAVVGTSRPTLRTAHIPAEYLRLPPPSEALWMSRQIF